MSQSLHRYRPFTDVRLEDQRRLRRTRSPQHSWIIRVRPWQLVPCLCAPVMAGESLRSAVIQMRAMSDPLRNPITGWWIEFYLFYVRILDWRAASGSAARDYLAGISSTIPPNGTVLAEYYLNSGLTNCPNPVEECLYPVVFHYFRNEGTTPLGTLTPLIENLPAVRVQGDNWLSSMSTDTELGTPSGSDTWNTQWNAYQALRAAKLTTNTFEEWLAKSGVEVPPQLRNVTDDERKPELIRFVRDFALPTPTINQSTGLPVSSVQWTLAERIDKRRYFAEPGYIVGYVVARPKCYLGNQGNNASSVTLALSPLVMQQHEFESDPHASLIKTTLGTGLGIVTGGTLAVWADVKDILLYGDQFVNVSPSAPPNADPGFWNIVALPSGAGGGPKIYPSLTDSRNMFVGGAGTDEPLEYIRADGICSLRIASPVASDRTAVISA